MIKTISFFLFLFCLSSGANSQDGQKGLFPELLSKDSMRISIEELTSVEMSGRKTGTQGQKKAAAFISNKLSHFDIKPLPGRMNFIHPHALSLRYNQGYNLEVHQKFYLFLEDYFYIRGYNDTTFILDSFLFMGYGISDSLYDDYNGIDVQNKAILIYDGEPEGIKFKKQSEASGKSSAWSTDWRKKLAIVYDRKPSVVFIISSNLGMISDSLLSEKNAIDFYRLAQAPSSIPIIFISEEMALNFFPEHQEYMLSGAKKKIERSKKSSSFSVSTDAVIQINSKPSVLIGENIMGIIEGSEKKDEYVILSAHYDHLGQADSSYYPGADDNASGVASVLEIARLFSAGLKNGKRPKRSVIFCFFSGEENGLMGSSYFVKNPVVPLAKIIANLNIDMLGRTDTIHTKEGSERYVYIIGADRLSEELYLVNENCNLKGPKLELDYKYDRPDDPNRFYYRSDHYHFSKNNIPVIFYFNGIHEDYHETTDTAEKINLELLSLRTRLIYLTTEELLNRKKRISTNRIFFDSYE
jgi:hypothetical protein